MIRQAHQVGHRRRVERRVRMQRPPCVGRHRIPVRPRRPRRRHPLGGPAAQPDTIQVPLRRVVRRGDDVQPPPALVDTGDRHHVVRAARHQLHVAPVARHTIDVAPPVALARPEKAVAANPRHVADDVDPRAVVLDERRAHGAGRSVAEHHPVAVLTPVDALDHHFAGAGPLHPRDVVVAQVTRQRDPRGRPAVRADDAGARRRVRRPRLGVLDRDRDRVQRVRVVDQREGADAGHVEVPVRDPRPVGRPAEAVGEAELLLVDPIGHAVHVQRVRAGRQPGDGAVAQALRIEVTLPYVRHAVRGRRKLPIHHGRRWTVVAAELAQRPGRPIEHPVIAPRVRPPDALRVREDEELGTVRRPRVIIDRQWRRRTGRHELLRGDEYAPLAARGHVPHDVESAADRHRWLDGRVCRAAVGPARRSEPLRRKIARRVQALQHRRGRGGDLRHLRHLRDLRGHRRCDPHRHRRCDHRETNRSHRDLQGVSASSRPRGRARAVH